jgi:putative transposase
MAGGLRRFFLRHSQLDTIVRYIENQEKHHRRRSFRDKYLTLLRKFEIDFREEYVFEFYDEHLFGRSEEWGKTLHS